MGIYFIETYQMKMKTASGETGLEQTNQDGTDMMSKGGEDPNENDNTSTTMILRGGIGPQIEKKRVIVIRTMPQL